MLNTVDSCTLYLQQAPSIYARRFVEACFWQEDETTLLIVIPAQQEVLPPPMVGAGKERDYVVRGYCPHEVTDAASLRTLLQSVQVFTIDSRCYSGYGGLPHYEVVAK